MQRLAVVIAVALGPSLPASEGVAKKDYKRQIFAAWKQRQERTKSFRFRWTRKVIQTRAGREARERKPLGVLKPAKGELKPIEYTQDWTFTVEGMKTRLEYTGHANKAYGSNDVRKVHTRRVYDGKKHTVVERRPNLSEGGEYPHATISPNNPELSLADLAPLLMAYRPLDATMVAWLNFDSFRLADETPVHQGNVCRVYRLGPISLWIDPSKASSVVRLQYASRDKKYVRAQTDIDYREDADHGWVVAGWRVTTHLPDGSLRTSSACNVTHYEINPQLSETTFQLTIPEDTLLVDQTAPRDSQMKIQLNGGRQHNVSNEPTTYSEALAEAHRNTSSRTWTLWWILAGVVVLLVIAWLAWRRKRLPIQSN